jgi:hypothetical protein
MSFNFQVPIIRPPFRRLPTGAALTLSKRAVAILILMSVPFSKRAEAQGIPEPSLVMYGVVRNAQDPDRLRLGFGSLTWTFQPAGGGTAFVVSTTLTNINDQFSYVLRVPCESDAPGIPPSTNVLRLNSSYTRSTVFFDGTNRATLTDPAQGTFALSPMARGQIERVDLDVSVALEDLDGNGLPDGWERLYFGRTGVDPFADPDRDGLNNLAEFKAGTNPNDFQSQFSFVRITRQGGGVLLEWSSVTNRSYSILRSSDLFTPFQALPGIRAATPPLNSFLDTTAVLPGPYFYRLRLQE